MLDDIEVGRGLTITAQEVAQAQRRGRGRTANHNQAHVLALDESDPAQDIGAHNGFA